MNLNPHAAYYSVDEVAETIGRSKDWLWAQCRTRKVPHHRKGRHYVFSPDDIAAIKAMVAPVPVEVAR
jgi:hypothetical protein